MNNIKIILPNLLPENFSGVAVISSVREKAGLVMIEVQVDKIKRNILAAYSVASINALRVGDKVHCIADNEGKAYVAALLDRGEDESDKVFHGFTSSRFSQEDVLGVYNKRNELIFEYDPKSDSSKVIVNSKTLNITLPEGDMNISAGGKVKIEGSSVELAAKNAQGVPNALFNLRQFSAEISSTLLSVESKFGKFRFDEADYVGEKLSSLIDSAKFTWKKVESFSDTVINNVRCQFINIKELSQTKAGRMRMIIENTFRLNANVAKIKTEENVDIDGKKINLG